ncbi:MAG: hypothetical protein KAG61_13465 [Bacteriovoracaceae bacterium]|nr:hypothetical protein [Bacteriovoracaceae bacterium]
MKKLLLLLLILSTASTFAFDYKVKGNKRSKSKYIKAVTKRCLQSNDGQYDKELLDQCIFNEKIFTKVTTKKLGNTIFIEVEDKWTLIPVPKYSTDGQDKTLGAYLVERNFLGKRKLLVLGASISTKGNSFFLMLKDPAVFQSRYTLLTRVIKASNTLSNMDQNRTLYSMKQDLSSAMVSSGYYYSDKLNISLGLKYTEKKFTRDQTYLPRSNHYSSQANLLLDYSDTKYKFFFNEGVEVKLNTAYDVITSENKNKLNFKIEFGHQKVFFKNHVLQIRSNYYREFYSEYHLTEKFGGKKGARGIKKRTLWTDEIINLAFDYQVKIKEFKSGVITIAPFLDLGSYRTLDSPKEHENYMSYGAGAYYYIKKIDLPAMGIQAGVNPKNMGRFFGLYIGGNG